MKSFPVRSVLTLALSVSLAGCTMLTGKPGSTHNPLCIFAGAVAGGGGAAAATSAGGPIGAAVLVGALVGNALCAKDAPPPAVAVTQTSTTVATTTTVPDPDSDGDGVPDSRDRCPGTPPGAQVDAHGCPKILLTLTGVNFKFDSSEIEPNSEEILNQAVAALNNAAAVGVRIEGHTDSTGPDAYNLQLSQRRAAAVQAYLVLHGIPAERLSTEGKGESQPVEPNTTAEGRFQNRRVEFHVAGSDPVSASDAPHSDNAWQQLALAMHY
jgi:OmpA-OmpF porin, OOP family